MIRELAYGFAGLVFLAYAVDLFLSIKDDPLEPRRIRPKVPLIGHILGLMQHGPTYYNHMRSENPLNATHPRPEKACNQSNMNIVMPRVKRSIRCPCSITRFT